MHRKTFYAENEHGQFLRFTTNELRNAWVAKMPSRRIIVAHKYLPLRKAMERKGAMWVPTNHPQVHVLRPVDQS